MIDQTPTPALTPSVVVVMGVSGCGKSTVAAVLANRTGAAFYEGDDFHPPENVSKMRNGIPLTDADREQWLKKLRKIIVGSLASGKLTVLTCSALKAKYREALAGEDPRVKFVHLTGSKALIEERLKNRQGHFMAPALQESQFAILEAPADALVFSCENSPEQIVGGLLPLLGIATD